MSNYKNQKGSGYINLSNNNTSQEKDFFCGEGVEKGCYEPIESRFDSLILRSGERPFDWYKDPEINLDKGYASKIRRGLIIPPLWLRRKIAIHFKTDSSAIWKVSDIDYIKLVLKQQKKRGEIPLNNQINEGDEDDQN